MRSDAWWLDMIIRVYGDEREEFISQLDRFGEDSDRLSHSRMLARAISHSVRHDNWSRFRSLTAMAARQADEEG